MNTVIITFILQGRVYVLMDSEFDIESDDQVPKTWVTIPAAEAWLKENRNKHLALRAASSITIVDVDTAEAESC